MSVFSLDASNDNPVTKETLEGLCSELGVRIAEQEKEDYHRLLAVFHDASKQLIALDDYVPYVDNERFPRESIYFPEKAENSHGAWAWKCSIIDKQSNHGKLHSKTFALKDNIAVKDVPMLLGTNFIKGYVPDVDATVTTRILEAGGHILGKAVCENLCHSATSHSSSTGIVESPVAMGYSAGGSSSGSGVLVALSEVDGAIGADQGGSIRVPAANCGIVGLKPTFGLVPYTGCGSNEPTNDHIGPMTRTVLENALLLEAIAGTDNIDDRSFAAPSPSRVPVYTSIVNMPAEQPLFGKKFAIIKESLSTPAMDTRVIQTFLVAVEKYTSLGATVTQINIPLHSKGAAIWTGVSKVGGYLSKTTGQFGRRGHQMLPLNSLFYPMSQANWDEAYASTKNIYLNGLYATKQFPNLLAKATNLSRQLRDAYDTALDQYDVLLTPTLPYVATSHAAVDATPLEQIAKQIGLTANTAPFNQSGHPVLALPIGMLGVLEGPGLEAGVKLPVSMQIIGKWWDEMGVFEAAYAWERENKWRDM
ncbi:amidase [Pyrenophora tritici-repentis]|uniref:Amidase signature enzyme n=1 Tax=Pyrenophora tritici-repentis TaxID=45151 RepID=A0A2W1EKJ1_9PLEO|nr:Amidase signature enzyme [Pyrenophora tritici-repentis]KAF7443170.1 Amidase signature enzyme [Pyrenophora tritici-repentis]KAG9377153.1 Amidase signature enzyme [Pyrenophora tritici-repentis]KAI0581791.1 Amidase signature enzyme [Pyrenophora tritici-repentis]KAI0610048.1 Amidase signature enzyme [Pyrenophora tritici-repentis]